MVLALILPLVKINNLKYKYLLKNFFGIKAKFENGVVSLYS